MKWQILKNPLGLLEIDMENGESVTAESGALVFIQGDVEVKTSTKIMEQGFFNRFKSVVLGGESIFLNDYIARGRCSIGLAGALLGDIESIYVDGSYIVQSRAYIASTGDIKMDTKFQGLTKGIFGTELFMLKLVGNGNIFVNAYGGVVKREVKNGERIVIDNYHLVAMDGNTNYRVVKIGSWKTFLLGGEGLGIEVVGPSTLYIQSRSEREIKDEFTRLLELDKLKREQPRSIWDKGKSDSKPWFQPNI
jgi:uncharacterized protein (TIGR00266 family)